MIKHINSTSIATAISLLLTTHAASADSNDRTATNERVGDEIVNTKLPSFAGEVGQQYHSVIAAELDVAKSMRLGDAAFDRQEYAKSLRFYRQAYYSLKLVEPEGDESEKEVETYLKHLPLRLAQNEQLMANYSIAMEILEDIGSEDNQVSIEANNSIAEIHLVNGNFDDAKEAILAAMNVARENSISNSTTVQSRFLENKLNASTTPLLAVSEYEKIAAAAEQFGKNGKRIQIQCALEQSKLCRTRLLMSQAEERARRALKLAQTSFGSDSSETADALTQLGASTQQTGGVQAKELLIKAISLQAARFQTACHPTVTYALLALVTGTNLSGTEKKLLAHAAKTSIDGILPDESPMSLHCLGVMASAYRVCGQFKLAVEADEKQVDIAEQLYGRESLEVASALLNLAMSRSCADVYRDWTIETKRHYPVGQPNENSAPSEAEKLAKRAESIFVKVSGADSLNVVKCLDIQIWILNREQKYNAAIAIGKRALELSKNNSDDSGRKLLEDAVWSDLRDSYVRLKQWDQAEEHLGPEIVSLIRRDGIFSKSFLDANRTLSQIDEGFKAESGARDRDSDAVEPHHVSDRKTETAPSPTETNKTSDLNADGTRRTTTLKTDTAPIPVVSARASLGESIRLKLFQVLPQEMTGLGGLMSMLVSHYSSPKLQGLLKPTASELRSNERTARGAVQSSKRKYGSDSPHISHDLVNLGRFLFGQERFAEAEKCFAQAEQNIRVGLGQDHPELLEVLPNYVELLKVMGNTQAACDKEKEINELYKKYDIPKPKPEIIEQNPMDVLFKPWLTPQKKK